ncbi:MAG TPA: transcription antitermination factor NusB [Thermomicrobiales bacterium]|nr:transcription antitermination factor NusB [Thermomicrobiales bacterium]
MDYDRIRQQLARGTIAGPDAPAPTEIADETDSAPPAGEPDTKRKRRRAQRAATSADHSNRHITRQLALLALFELDVTDHDYEDVVHRVITDPFLSAGRQLGNLDDGRQDAELDLPADALRDMANLERGVRDLVYGVIRSAREIDATILEVAPAYPIDRIGTIDRNVLRLGIYELEYVRDQPIPEVVSGNVELGKRFGGDTTAAFVNGVLRTISDRIPADERPPETSAERRSRQTRPERD